MRSLGDIIADIDSSVASPLHTADDHSDASGESRQYIKFMLNDYLMAAPIRDTLEIGRHPFITALPNLPGWILGISNVRGEIVSMVDLKAFFNMAAPAVKRNDRFIILHNPVFKVGIIVDRILGIFSWPQAHTDEFPFFEPEETSPKRAEWAGYVQKVIPQDGNNLVNVLDIKLLLASPQMNALSSP